MAKKEAAVVKGGQVLPRVGPSKQLTVKSWKTSAGLYLLMLPSVVLLFIFNYIPLFGLLMSFQDYSPFLGISGSKWVGFENFMYFLADPMFWTVFKNTIIISLLDLTFGFTAPILFAILANEIMNRPFKRIMQTISYLPHFLSWIVVGGLVKNMLSPVGGMFNVLLSSVFGMEPIYFMTEPSMFRPILIIADIWKGVGWGSILYFSVIASIDTQLYEAAEIDGAGKIKQAWHITLPGMLPMIVLLLLLRIAGLFNVGFDRIFNMYNDLVLNVSDVISTYTYRLGVINAEYSLSTAIGFTQSLFGFILLVSANWISGKLVGLGLY